MFETLLYLFLMCHLLLYKVGKHLLSVYARNSWMNEEQ